MNDAGLDGQRHENYVVRSRSRMRNVYHCCAPKTGSQWLRALFSDPRVYVYSGLRSFDVYHSLAEDFDPRTLANQQFVDPVPLDTFVTPLYISYQSFLTIPKPEPVRSFFILRDPRDIVVSLYFSTMYSHPIMGSIGAHRANLQQLSIADGLAYSIENGADMGIFASLASWQAAAHHDPNVCIVRFEDLIGPSTQLAFETLFLICDVALPDDVLAQLLYDYRFERLSEGRRPGDEDHTSHYRKGVAGDWQNYFDGSTERVMRDSTGDLVTRLGYMW